MAMSADHNGVKITVGDVVKINYKIREKDGKDRIQAFDGTILAIKGHRPAQNILIQKKATDGVKVERIIPLNSPWVESIKKIRSAKTTVRRSKLYFLRDDKARTL